MLQRRTCYKQHCRGISTCRIGDHRGPDITALSHFRQGLRAYLNALIPEHADPLRRPELALIRVLHVLAVDSYASVQRLCIRVFMSRVS